MKNKRLENGSISRSRAAARVIALLTGLVVGGCDATETTADPLEAAERFIDAFYAYDAQALAQTLQAPAEQVDRVVYYQAWAEAAHYRVQTRRPCEVISQSVVTCAVTVTDDFGQTLGYTATDTFRLTMAQAQIVGVEFEGDDPPIFDALFAWIAEHQPEVLSGPCKDLFAGGTTPAACARAVVAAARMFVE